MPVILQMSDRKGAERYSTKCTRVELSWTWFNVPLDAVQVIFTGLMYQRYTSSARSLKLVLTASTSLFNWDLSSLQ